jgi:septum formation topological specificity factor MinE
VNYELVGILGAVGSLVALAFLYARAASKAALVDQVELINGHLQSIIAAQRTVVRGKEEYIRELEKTVLGTLPPGKLVERLNLLFASERGRAPGAVQAAKRTP